MGPDPRNYDKLFLPAMFKLGAFGGGIGGGYVVRLSDPLTTHDYCSCWRPACNNGLVVITPHKCKTMEAVARYGKAGSIEHGAKDCVCDQPKPEIDK